MVCLLLMSIAIGVASWMDRDLPTSWGTFTEQATRCDPGYSRRSDCTSIGTWVSDDGKTTLHEVRLDGGVASHATTRAAYKPGGAMGANDVVHRATRTHPDLWLPWVLSAVIAGCILLARREWHKRGATPTNSAQQADAY